METLTKPIQFNFRKVWNDSLVMDLREPKERSYQYATEFSKPLIDRYLAMRGTPITNPPNERSFRKFFSGNIWGFVCGVVLHQLGIVKTSEQVVNIEDLPVPVHGRLDYLVGGVPDYDKARKVLASYPFEPELMNRFMKVIDNFEQTIGDSEIETVVHEIKSCSEFVIDMIQEGGRINGHLLQIYHYLRGLNMPRGVISYISKNDNIMEDVIVNYPDAKLENIYLTELQTLKNFLDLKISPPKAPLIIWEDKFKKNMGVEYSNFLTLIYGFKEPKDYSDSVKGKLQSWNRLLKRLKDINDGKLTPTGKKMEITKKNEEAIKAIEAEGWKPFELAAKAKIEIEEEDEL